MRKLFPFLVSFALLIAAFSCSQGYVVNMNAGTDYPEGRDLYVSKCGGCHQLFDPKSYTDGQWNKIMSAMQVKSKINDRQKAEIINWIIETERSPDTSNAMK